MKKKNYQTPTMQVVEIQQCAILVRSERKGRGENYTWEDEDEEITNN